MNNNTPKFLSLIIILQTISCTASNMTSTAAGLGALGGTVAGGGVGAAIAKKNANYVATIAVNSFIGTGIGWLFGSMYNSMDNHSTDYFGEGDEEEEKVLVVKVRKGISRSEARLLNKDAKIIESEEREVSRQIEVRRMGVKRDL